MSVTIQVRRDTAANWASVNPVLAQGEIGLETDTAKAKVGDGATAWASLGYWEPGGTYPLTTLGDLLYEGASGSARLPGNATATREFLTQQGTGAVSAAPAWGTIQAADVPVLNQNTTGTAANVTGTVAVANGGTGQVTQAAAITALTGAQSAGTYLRSNGTSAALAAIQAPDLPGATTLAQGAVQLAGDLAGTSAGPQVTGTHLGSPLPVAQGGSASAYQQPGTTPAYPLVLAPAKWAMVSLDTGPDVVLANYDNKTITFNTGATGNSSSQQASFTVTVPAGVLAGDLMVLVVNMNSTSNAGSGAAVSSSAGTTFTRVGSPVVTGTGTGIISLTAFTAVAGASDAGSTLTVTAQATGTFFGSATLGAYTGAASAGVSATAFTASGSATATAPSVTTTVTGEVVLWAATANVPGSGTAVVSGTQANTYAFQREATSTGGNVTVLGDTCQWWPSGTAQGGVQFSGVTATWAMMTLALVPAAGYDGSVLPTLTAKSNGTLSIDGGNPATGDRVIVAQNFGNALPANQGDPSGVYTVTSTGGAASKWTMSRAADHATSAALGQFWAVDVLYGQDFGAGGSVRVIDAVPGPISWFQQAQPVGSIPVYGMPWVMGTSGLALASQAPYSCAYGQSTTAIGTYSAAYGTQGSATVSNAIALGNSSVAGGGTAIGSYSTTSNDSVTVGRYSYAAANGGIAVGAYTSAYSPDLTVLASGQIATTGDSQRSLVVFAGQTTTATPKAITPQDGAFAFNGRTGTAADWTKTALVKLTAVARRKDVPGTDSAWSAQGIVRGNGSSSYSWVGGTAPSFTVIAQDAGAAAWAVTVAISSNGLTVTVTGAAAETINWAVTAELYEVAG